MKVGDLVNFVSHSALFSDAERRYSNPGLIVEEDREPRQARYTIMWADGRLTTEFPGYLEKARKP